MGQTYLISPRRIKDSLPRNLTSLVNCRDSTYSKKLYLFDGILSEVTEFFFDDKKSVLTIETNTDIRGCLTFPEEVHE